MADTAKQKRLNICFDARRTSENQVLCGRRAKTLQELFNESIRARIAPDTEQDELKLTETRLL